jgi:glycosyltransferase involved in cell wall biosynthesis
MRICFLDPTNFDYTIETPLHEPLGGSQSGLCYLAHELQRLGHAVTVINGTSKPGVHNGVAFVSHKAGLFAESLNQQDAVIVLNSTMGLRLREELGIQTPLVLWTGHAIDQPAVRRLNGIRDQAAFAGFAFVSQWQRDQMIAHFSLPREKCHVLRNAAAPPFVDLEPVAPWFSNGRAPVLCYTSTPFRGLDVLLYVFPTIRAAVPGTRLRVFSSMAPYQVSASKDTYNDLYRQCAATDGAEYVGAIGQRDLCRELTGVAALAYPSTFAETSCIAVIEAMAAGAAMLTTRLGALPETTGGFAHMIELQGHFMQFADDYAAMVVRALREMQAKPEEAAARRDAQIAFVRANYTWSGRAKEWDGWLSELIKR